MDDLERLKERAKLLLRQYREARTEDERTALLAQYGDIMQAVRDLQQAGKPEKREAR